MLMESSQLTNTIQRARPGENQQVLDKLKVERERGITGTLHVRLQRSASERAHQSRRRLSGARHARPCADSSNAQRSMFYKLNGEEYLLNLIDTPVSAGLSAVRWN